MIAEQTRLRGKDPSSVYPKRGEGRLKRDMEVIRAIMAEVEAWPNASPRMLEIQGWDADVVEGHVAMMNSAGLIEVVNQQYFGGVRQHLITDLTWAGHEFSASLKNPKVWKWVMGLKDDLAQAPLTAIANVATAMVEDILKRQAGLA